MWCTLETFFHTAPVILLRLLEAYAGLLLRLFFTSLAPRTQSIYFLHWDAIVLSSSSNIDDDDGGHGGDGDDDGDGDGDGEEKIPQLCIYKLPINRPSGRILGVIGVIGE